MSTRFFTGKHPPNPSDLTAPTPQTVATSEDGHPHPPTARRWLSQAPVPQLVVGDLAWCRSGSTARGREVFTGQSRFTCHLAASTVPPNPLPHFSLSHTEGDHTARNAFSYIKRNIVGIICREINYALFWLYLAAGFYTHNLAKDNSLSRIGNP